MLETGTLSHDLRRYLALVWHWGWLLALATILAGSAAYFFSQRTIPVYQATTTVLINEAPGARSNEYTALLTSERLARTYSELLTKRPVLQGVIDRLGLPISERNLRQAVSVELVRDTQLIEVRVEDTSPVRAALIANTLVEVFIEQNQTLQASRYTDSKASLEAQLAEVDAQIQETSAAIDALPRRPESQAERDQLEARLAQYRQTYASLLQSFEQVRVTEAQATSNVVQVDPATPPERPIRPRTLMNTALAAVVGLMIAMGVVFLIEALDDTVKGPDDIARHLGLPVLALIARAKEADGAPITAAQPRSPVAEAYRVLRTNIQYASVDRRLHTLLVTSPSPQDGKTTIAANLGVVLAQSGQQVILVDSDLRRPALDKHLRMPNRRGLSDLFVRPETHLDGTLRKTSVPRLSLLTSGGLPPNPAELIGSEKMFSILGLLKQQADMVVLDSPPLMAVTDAAILAPRVDGVLLVVRPGSTKLGACKQAVELLRRGGANLLGVVLNDVQAKRGRYSYYYQGYYYTSEYSQDGSGARRRRRRTVPREAEDGTTTV